MPFKSVIQSETKLRHGGNVCRSTRNWIIEGYINIIWIQLHIIWSSNLKGIFFNLGQSYFLPDTDERRNVCGEHRRHYLYQLSSRKLTCLKRSENGSHFSFPSMITKFGWLMYGFCFINSHSQLTLTTLKNNKQVNIVSNWNWKWEDHLNHSYNTTIQTARRFQRWWFWHIVYSKKNDKTELYWTAVRFMTFCKTMDMSINNKFLLREYVLYKWRSLTSTGQSRQYQRFMSN